MKPLFKTTFSKRISNTFTQEKEKEKVQNRTTDNKDSKNPQNTDNA